MKDLINRLRDTPNWRRDPWGGSWKDFTTKIDRAPFEAADALEAQQAEIEFYRNQEMMAHKECDRLQAEIEALRGELEIDPRHHVDGIQARDATIKLLEGEVAAQQARIAELREAMEYGPQRLEAIKARDLNCGCDHNEYCEKCFPPEFRPGGPFGAMPEQVMREALSRTDDLSALESIKAAAKREALMEAADAVELTSEETSCKRAAEKLRRMAGEVK